MLAKNQRITIQLTIDERKRVADYMMLLITIDKRVNGHMAHKPKQAKRTKAKNKNIGSPSGELFLFNTISFILSQHCYTFAA